MKGKARLIAPAVGAWSNTHQSPKCTGVVAAGAAAVDAVGDLVLDELLAAGAGGAAAPVGAAATGAAAALAKATMRLAALCTAGARLRQASGEERSYAYVCVAAVGDAYPTVSSRTTSVARSQGPCRLATAAVTIAASRELADGKAAPLGAVAVSAGTGLPPLAALEALGALTTAAAAAAEASATA